MSRSSKISFWIFGKRIKPFSVLSSRQTKPRKPPPTNLTKFANASKPSVKTCSMAATTGGFQLAHYAAAKAAVETLTKSATWEAARLGLRINAVAPGTISGGHASAEESARFAKSTPLGRAGNAEEVAAAVLWLASPEASYVTGTVLPVSGGR